MGFANTNARKDTSHYKGRAGAWLEPKNGYIQRETRTAVFGDKMLTLTTL